jgi:CheY-like chemotaxis protein
MVRAPAERVSVLVVDDEDELRATVVEMFEFLGADVFDAASGREALRILSFNPHITLLFTDVRMPGLSGVELARQARAMRPGLRVVLASAYIEDEAVWGFPLLRKPYRLADLAPLLMPPQEAGAPPPSGTTPTACDERPGRGKL